MNDPERDLEALEPEFEDRRAVLKHALAAAAALGTFAPSVQAFAPAAAGSSPLPIDDLEPSMPAVGNDFCTHTVLSSGVGCGFPFTNGTQVCVDCPGLNCIPHNGGTMRTYRLRSVCAGGITCTGTWTQANGGAMACVVGCTGTDGFAYC